MYRRKRERALNYLNSSNVSFHSKYSLFDFNTTSQYVAITAWSLLILLHSIILFIALHDIDFTEVFLQHLILERDLVSNLPITARFNCFTVSIFSFLFRLRLHIASRVFTFDSGLVLTAGTLACCCLLSILAILRTSTLLTYRRGCTELIIVYTRITLIPLIISLSTFWICLRIGNGEIFIAISFRYYIVSWCVCCICHAELVTWKRLVRRCRL